MIDDTSRRNVLRAGLGLLAGILIPVKAYAYNEIRYKMLTYMNPDEAARLLAIAQEDVNQRWRVYTSMAERWPGNAARTRADRHAPMEVS